MKTQTFFSCNLLLVENFPINFVRLKGTHHRRMIRMMTTFRYRSVTSTLPGRIRTAETRPPWRGIQPHRRNITQQNPIAMYQRFLHLVRELFRNVGCYQIVYFPKQQQQNNLPISFAFLAVALT